MSEPVAFTSECPRCGRERALVGYSADELVELLDSAAAIEGYCINCDKHWPISTEERADLARSLSRPK